MKQKIKILHLEDISSDAELIERALKKGKMNPEIFVVPDKAAFVKALSNFSYDIILSDHSLASFDSLEAIQMIKKADIIVPFIIVTAAMTDEFAAKIMKEGADDYILKDRLGRLPASVANSVEKHRLKVENDNVKIKTDRERNQLAARLQLATRSAGMGIWEWDIKEDHLIWDEGMYMLYNLDNLRFGSVYEGWISRIHPDDKQRVNEDIQMAVAGERKYDTEFKVIWDDASIHTLKATGVVELDNDGKPDRMIGANWDISLQRSTEEKIIKANRLYTFIGQINQSIVRVKDEKVLFRAACDIALEFGKFTIAWIGLFDKLNKVITLVDQNGVPAADIQQFKDVPLKTGGPQEHVLNTGNYFVSNDIANDPGLEDLKAMSTRYDINSCIIIPVKKSGNVIGTFNLYSSKLNFFDIEEIGLLLEATGDISFALDLFEKERAHRHTEELVLQNEKRFRALIENNADMITLGNRRGELIYGSPAITAILGYSPSELIGMQLYDVVHPDDIPELLESRTKLLDHPGKSFNFEHRRKRKNGDWLWCEGTFINLLDEPGINAIVTNFRDISEKKSAEQQQEFDRNNLDALINNTNDLMWSVDLDFKLITSNKTFNDILIFTTGDALATGDNILEATYSKEQAKPYKKLYERAFAGESFTEVIYNEPLVNSWSEISYCPIHKGNEVIGAACHSRDITEKKLAEIERIKMVNDLMLRNAELEQFGYIISHNLRGPVANIIGASSILSDPDLSTEDKEILNRGINLSVTKLDDVVKDLNHILQVKADINETKEVVGFSMIVDDVIFSIQDLVDKYGVKIKCDFSEIGEFLTLKPYLYSIFYNIISNSIKYRQQDIPCIIAIESRLEKNKMELIFKDNGIGIDLGKNGGDVFGLYKRFHTNIEGKGMGLFMVKTQVETLGGKISVKSTENKGTEFKLEFEV